MFLEMTRATIRNLLLAAIKVALSGLLIWFIATKIDIANALVHLRNLNGAVALAVIAIIISGFAVSSNLNANEFKRIPGLTLLICLAATKGE